MVSCNGVTPFSRDRQIIWLPVGGLATLSLSFLGLIANGTVRILRKVSKGIVRSLGGNMAPLPFQVTLRSWICQPSSDQTRDQAEEEGEHFPLQVELPLKEGLQQDQLCH